MLYPNNAKKEYHKLVNYANRGMNLENLINEANDYYLQNDIAVIYKKPTPVAIKKVIVSGNDKKITGSLKQKSTLDYVGLYDGYYLDFDAKSTKNKNDLPLANIHEHQIEHIKKIINHKGLAFLIIEINNLFFILKGDDLINYVDNSDKKQIPLSYIKEKGLEIKLGYCPTLDYLKIIEKEWIKKGVSNEKD